jgi:CheY-like chemotaxis protein
MLQVLVVEDNSLNRMMVRQMLVAVGNTVTEAEDARSALALIDEQDFDVVVMDLRMPQMDGLAAIKAIRARADAKADLPIVVITADVNARSREQCLAAGADCLLLKPFEMSKLFKAIGRAIARRPASLQVAS